jgi:hypothetical protein
MIGSQGSNVKAPLSSAGIPGGQIKGSKGKEGYPSRTELRNLISDLSLCSDTAIL